jgi:hypothetical protein
MVDIKHSNAHDCPIVEAIIPLFSSCQCGSITSKKGIIMVHKLSQVSKRSNTPDIEEYNGLTWKTGIVILDPLLEELIG